MRVVITGANGFLGPYLVGESFKSAFEVHALVRPGANMTNLDRFSDIGIHQINYKDQLSEQIKSLKEKIGEVDYFIHNAGLTVSRKKEAYFDVNTQLTKEIIQAIKETKLLSKNGKVIYVSSYAAHGPSKLNRPVSAYGESKLQAEEFIKNAQIDYKIIRPTAIYGAGDFAFLPLFKGANKALYPLIRKDQKISMIHAADLAKAIISSLDIDTKTIYVSDGNTYSHHDFIDTLKTCIGKKIYAIRINKWLAKTILGISGFFESLFGIKPSMTLEKFEEINQDWDLHAYDLYHAPHNSNKSLLEGFQDAYSYYQKNNLL